METKKLFDVVLLTDGRYLLPNPESSYISNIFEDDFLLTKALEDKGLRVFRTNWDDAQMDWSSTRFALFRSTWDYFERIIEFREWLGEASKQTNFINSAQLVNWNLDKHYLQELNEKGLAIPPTIFLEIGENRSLEEIISKTTWKKYILKPAISGAARHTYLFQKADIQDITSIFEKLIASESMLLQEYQEQIESKGEISIIVINGKYAFSVLKKAKQGDFRVQDDFGGTLHPYQASKEEIEFAEKSVSLCAELPLYARVDLIWDNDNQLCLSELELIEPELWIRRFPEIAELMANAVFEKVKDLKPSFS